MNFGVRNIFVRRTIFKLESKSDLRNFKRSSHRVSGLSYRSCRGLMAVLSVMLITSLARQRDYPTKFRELQSRKLVLQSVNNLNHAKLSLQNSHN